MRSVLFKIGPLEVYGYGLMLAIGVLAGYFCTVYRGQKQGLSVEQCFSFVFWCVIPGFIGAKLLFWITEWQDFIRYPGTYLKSFSDGFVIYGGILGGILGAYIFCRLNRLSFLAMADLGLPSAALGQGFGRIGCLLAGCCYGKPASFPPSITFHDSDFAPSGIPLIPTQIYSSLLDFLHFFILLYIARHKRADGEVAAWYLILYSSGRFILEFFRGDIERGSVGPLSTSQFIALFTLAAGIGLFVWLHSRRPRSPAASA